MLIQLYKSTKISLLMMLSLISVISLSAQEQDIRVGLYRSFELRTVIFKAIKGSYTLTNQDSVQIKMEQSDVIFATAINDQLSLWNSTQHLGVHSSIKITSDDEMDGKMSIEPAYPILVSQKYYGDFEIFIDSAFRMTLVNIVPFTKYLTCVVEAESGVGSLPEFYKAQAIICRTYALNSISRHRQEGFFICDEVHCQVYKGIKTEHKPILKAVDDTKGDIIIDSAGMLITAAFHANSGGHTANSEDVWSSSMPYLRGKPDPYFDKQRHSHWKKTVTLKEWNAFLNKNNIQVKKGQKYSFQQPSRQKFMLVEGHPIILTDVRKAFALKSTFFSIEQSSNKIVFRGKGYGHGVGLSQESAMIMAKKGKTYDEIINFFYDGVKIIDMYETTYLQSMFPE